MIKQFSEELVETFGGDSVRICSMLTQWWNKEKAGSNLNDVKRSVRLIGSMAGEWMIRMHDWFDSFAERCNYEDVMKNVLLELPNYDFEESDIDKLLNMLISDVLLNDLMDLYPEEMNRGDERYATWQTKTKN